MNCVAAKVAQKICMLLEHDDVDAGAGQQKTEHHAGRATAGDAAARLHLPSLRRHSGCDGTSQSAARQVWGYRTARCSRFLAKLNLTAVFSSRQQTVSFAVPAPTAFVYSLL